MRTAAIPNTTRPPLADEEPPRWKGPRPIPPLNRRSPEPKATHPNTAAIPTVTVSPMSFANAGAGRPSPSPSARASPGGPPPAPRRLAKA